MSTVVIDTRCHADVGPDAIVGGLTLFERTTRFAARTGWTRAVVLSDGDLPTIASPRLEIEHADEAPGDLPVLQSNLIYGGDAEALEVRHTIVDDASRAAAEDDLWNSCRKPVDGIVSRHLNRHISLFISRRIAHTRVMPNHVTAVTFSLGVISAVFVGVGGWLGFAIGGFLFQATSVLDGVDGELARVRFDGSVQGEWLDTISDDSSDVFFYAALGVGAFRVLYATPVPATIWLFLGFGAALGKLASMAVYYRWLRARGRGDLLAFNWSFDDDSNQTSIARLLGGLRYITKNDFIAFAAMLLGFAGLLPWFLIAAFVGTWVVAFAALRESSREAAP
jgi:phosphatidylglycerophosphate synthase